MSIDEARAALETLDFGVDFGRRRGGAGLARYRDAQGPRQCGVMLGGIEQERRQPVRPQLYQGFRGERLRFRHRFARETEGLLNFRRRRFRSHSDVEREAPPLTP